MLGTGSLFTLQQKGVGMDPSYPILITDSTTSYHASCICIIVIFLIEIQLTLEDYSVMATEFSYESIPIINVTTTFEHLLDHCYALEFLLSMDEFKLQPHQELSINRDIITKEIHILTFLSLMGGNTITRRAASHVTSTFGWLIC